MDKQNLVRPILEEFRGYLSVAPNPEKNHSLFDDHIWNQFNSAIDELNSATGNDYSKFKVQPKQENWNGRYLTVVKAQDYISKLSGLINRVKAEFFYDEKPVMSPNTIINTNQFQNQEQQQSVVVDLAFYIAEKKADYPKGTKERDFLDKLGESIKKTKNITEIIKDLVSIGTSCGIGLAEISKIFNL